MEFSTNEARRFQRAEKIVFSLFICAGLAVMFCVYSYLPFESVMQRAGAPLIFNSPDETANYHFSQLFAETGQLGYREELLKPSKGLVHPRSMTVAGENVVPVSFLGLPVIYGYIAQWVGIGVIPFLTPFFAVIAAPFFYLLIRSFFTWRIAFFSTILLLIHPAYWYYSSRSLLPNVLFVDLCVMGLAILIVTLRHPPPDQKKEDIRGTHWWRWLAVLMHSPIVRGLGSGAFLGLALAVRFSEITWIGPLVAFILLFHVRRIRPLFLISFLLAGLCATGILFFFNNQVYGNPLIFGYQTLNMVPSAVALEQSLDIIRTLDTSRVFELGGYAMALMSTVLTYLLPFGVVPSIFSEQFMDYFIKMFWWFLIPALVGMVIVARRAVIDAVRQNSFHALGYLFASCAIGAWLVVYYGSWTVVDNIANEVTIGNAYVRYWLPFTVALIPFTAIACTSLLDGVKSKIVKFCMIGCMACMILYSFHSTLWQSSDSLLAVRERLAEYADKRARTLLLTPENAVIISPRSDKIFFPQRKVAQHFEGFAEAPLIADLSAHAPVYYYGFWDPELARSISDKYFRPHALALTYVASFGGNEYLYKVVGSTQLP